MKAEGSLCEGRGFGLSKVRFDGEKRGVYSFM